MITSARKHQILHDYFLDRQLPSSRIAEPLTAPASPLGLVGNKLMPVAVKTERDCTAFDSPATLWGVHSDPSGSLSSVGTLCPGELELFVKRTIIVDGRTVVDVRELYDLARWSLVCATRLL